MATSRKCHVLLLDNLDSPGWGRNEHLPIKGHQLITFFRPNDRFCVVSTGLQDDVKASIIPDVVKSVAASSDSSTVAASSSSKAYVSGTGAPFELNYISLPQGSSGSTTQGSHCSFSPKDASQLAVACARDIRIMDLNRSVVSFAAPAKNDPPRPLITISGAAAQAVPVSFAYLNQSPHVILTSWDLAPSPYVRMLDLRESSSKSVRIWRSRYLNGLTSSVLEDCKVAAFYEKEAVIWDLRSSLRGDKQHASGEDMIINRVKCDTGISQIHWSRAKRSTLGLLTDVGQLRMERVNTGRSESITPPLGRAGAFQFTLTNDLLIMNDSDGSVSLVATRKDPIPIVDPRSGLMLSVDNTGAASEKLVASDSIVQLEAIVRGLAAEGDEEQPSLVEAVRSLQDEELLDNIDWILPDHIHFDTVAEPLYTVFHSGNEILIGTAGSLGIETFTSPERLNAIDLLVSDTDKKLVLAILRGEWQMVVRQLVGDPDRYPLLCRSATQMFIPGEKSQKLIQIDGNTNTNIVSAVEIINRILSVDTPANRLEKVKALASDSSSGLAANIRALAALIYVPKGEELAAILADISKETNLTNLRCLVLTGMTRTSPVVSNFLHSHRFNVVPVALVGLFLYPHPEAARLPPVINRTIKFTRDLCNRLQGDFWIFRSIIDSIVDSAASVGSARLICYYCTKPIAAPSQSPSVSGFASDSTVADSTITRCPHRGCHKPLPACCVCLEPLRVSLSAATPLEDWSVWCATCRHGGHKNHLTEWFSNFDECPVAGCACQCTNVDGV